MCLEWWKFIKTLNYGRKRRITCCKMRSYDYLGFFMLELVDHLSMIVLANFLILLTCHLELALIITHKITTSDILTRKKSYTK